MSTDVVGDENRTLSLADQIRLFDLRVPEVRWLLVELLVTRWGSIRREAERRLIAGHKTYGDSMYRWDAERRYKELIEELADAVVYATSGGIR